MNPNDEYLGLASRDPGCITHAPQIDGKKIREMTDALVHREHPPTSATMAATQMANVLTAPERGVPEETLRDMVTLPHHYARFPIEPIKFICENGLNFFQANIVKYVLRHDAKNGLEDLKKAQRYLTMFIRFIEKDPDWWK